MLWSNISVCHLVSIFKILSSNNSYFLTLISDIAVKFRMHGLCSMKAHVVLQWGILKETLMLYTLVLCSQSGTVQRLVLSPNTTVQQGHRSHYNLIVPISDQCFYIEQMIMSVLSIFTKLDEPDIYNYLTESPENVFLYLSLFLLLRLFILLSW